MTNETPAQYAARHCGFTEGTPTMPHDFQCEKLPNGLIRCYDYACKWANLWHADGRYSAGAPWSAAAARAVADYRTKPENWRGSELKRLEHRAQLLHLILCLVAERGTSADYRQAADDWEKASTAVALYVNRKA